MTQAQEIVLNLLRLAVGQDNISIPIDAPWKKVMEFASKQGVFGVCFDGIEKLPSNERPDVDALMNWIGQIFYQEKLYGHNWEVACELGNLFAKSGIKPTVLKGRSIAQYYPKPAHRYSCDLDIFQNERGSYYLV